MSHRAEASVFICHHRSIEIVRPCPAGGLPQHPRHDRSVTAAAECPSARAALAVLVLSPPLPWPQHLAHALLISIASNSSSVVSMLRTCVLA